MNSTEYAVWIRGLKRLSDMNQVKAYKEQMGMEKRMYEQMEKDKAYDARVAANEASLKFSKMAAQDAQESLIQYLFNDANSEEVKDFRHNTDGYDIKVDSKTAKKDKLQKKDTDMYYIMTDKTTKCSEDKLLLLNLAQEEANQYGKPVHIYVKNETVQPEAKPEWIPALVKFQEVPSWWQMKEVKSKLMGEVILVKQLTSTEKRHNSLTYSVSVEYRSKRFTPGFDAPKGLWNWSKEDLVLYPTKADIEYNKALVNMAGGFKRRPL